MLALDPARRLTAVQALEHPYFSSLPLPAKPDDFAFPRKNCHEFSLHVEQVNQFYKSWPTWMGEISTHSMGGSIIGAAQNGKSADIAMRNEEWPGVKGAKRVKEKEKDKEKDSLLKPIYPNKLE